MYKAAVRWQIRRGLRTVNAGDPDPQIRAYAPEATLVFPGISSWSGRYQGRQAIADFLRFCTRQRLQLQAEDILVNGPPWRTRVCIICAVTATGIDGEPAYSNRAAMFARVRWGKITYQEDYEDTHQAERFDRHLKDLQTDLDVQPPP